ncbi:5-hydroxyisourate hydrolase-like isoform X2 [Sphaerodactylus townsendi]|uniref:5-hydroxyisourate hydrolase-like isoform X2 n=1 Tax=Sphaerodactylus townsendi TaxID=933632 RepID=UPI00202747E7|nr:5-hydroxyisourate hydrolase-like isoform X2 [Sphaerodactylus townsendi]
MEQQRDGAQRDGQSAGPQGGLTVHTMNVLNGLPASGIDVTFFRLEDSPQPWVQLTKSGRSDLSSAIPRRLEPGTYKLCFETAAYWQQQGYASFYPYVEVVFTVTEAEQKVHIPLLLSPFSYSTYRGS